MLACARARAHWLDMTAYATPQVPHPGPEHAGSRLMYRLPTGEEVVRVCVCGGGGG